MSFHSLITHILVERVVGDQTVETHLAKLLCKMLIASGAHILYVTQYLIICTYDIPGAYRTDIVKKNLGMYNV